MPGFGSVGNTAGMLRHRCTISVKVPQSPPQNSFGEDIYIWVSVGTFPCFVDPTPGTEIQMAQQRWAEAKYLITMRHQPGLFFTGKERFYWINTNRYLDILNVEDPGESNPWITMIARDYDGTVTD